MLLSLVRSPSLSVWIIGIGGMGMQGRHESPVRSLACNSGQPETAAILLPSRRGRSRIVGRRASRPPARARGSEMSDRAGNRGAGAGTHAAAIETLFQEAREFPPPPDFASQ